MNDRKQALIAESDLNRVAFRLEWENLKSTATRLDRIASSALRVAPWLLPLVPMAGFMAGRPRRHERRQRRERFGPVRTVRFLLRWAPAALSLWRRFTSANRQR